MSATVTDEVLAAGGTPPDGRPSWRTVRTMLAWLLSFAALAVVVGFLSGVFWWGVVDLPTYTIGEDFRGYTTEHALTEVFSTDAWFAGLGLTIGAGVGYVAWRWFRDGGWPVTFAAVLPVLIASAMGPDEEEEPRPKRPRHRRSETGRNQPVEVGQVFGHDIAPLPEPEPRRRFFPFRHGGGS